MLTINCTECGTTITDRSEIYERFTDEPLCWDCYYRDDLYGFAEYDDDDYDEEFEDDE